MAVCTLSPSPLQWQPCQCCTLRRNCKTRRQRPGSEKRPGPFWNGSGSCQNVDEEKVLILQFCGFFSDLARWIHLEADMVLYWWQKPRNALWVIDCGSEVVSRFFTKLCFLKVAYFLGTNSSPCAWNVSTKGVSRHDLCLICHAKRLPNDWTLCGTPRKIGSHNFHRKISTNGNSKSSFRQHY